MQAHLAKICETQLRPSTSLPQQHIICCHALLWQLQRLGEPPCCRYCILPAVLPSVSDWACTAARAGGTTLGAQVPWRGLVAQSGQKGLTGSLPGGSALCFEPLGLYQDPLVGLSDILAQQAGLGLTGCFSFCCQLHLYFASLLHSGTQAMM